MIGIPDEGLKIQPRVALLTGARGAGKSTLCARLAREARLRGISVGGVACPGVLGPDGSKRGCRARDLGSGEEWELGSMDRDLGGPRWKDWSFSAEGFQRANRTILEALEQGLGLILADEIGPVELKLGAGLDPALRALDKKRNTPASTPALVILVVRPELIAELSARFPEASLESVSPENRESAFRRMSAMVLDRFCI